MFDTMKVAKEIREARIAKNMTQMNLADEMGVSYQAVSNWERGGSMPDIGKLEELCHILDLSLDQLLGVKRQVENVQKVMDYANGKGESLSLEAIGDAAPLMKPDMINHLTGDIQDEEVDLGELCGIAPFVDKEVLSMLAARVREVNLGELCGLAPFLEREMLGTLAERIDEEEMNLGELCGLAPFVDKEVLGMLAARVKEVSLGELCGLAPFLERDMLGVLAERIDEEEMDLGELCGLAPFLEKEVLGTLAEKIPVDQLELDELCGLAPFMDKEVLGQLIAKRYR